MSAEPLPASELAMYREIAGNGCLTLEFPMPVFRALLRHIDAQDQEIARLRRLVENRPAVVVPLRKGTGA